MMRACKLSARPHLVLCPHSWQTSEMFGGSPGKPGWGDSTNQKKSYTFAPCSSQTSLVLLSKVSSISTGVFLWLLCNTLSFLS